MEKNGNVEAKSSESTTYRLIILGCWSCRLRSWHANMWSYMITLRLQASSWLANGSKNLIRITEFLSPLFHINCTCGDCGYTQIFWRLSSQSMSSSLSAHFTVCDHRLRNWSRVAFCTASERFTAVVVSLTSCHSGTDMTRVEGKKSLQGGWLKRSVYSNSYKRSNVLCMDNSSLPHSSKPNRPHPYFPIYSYYSKFLGVSLSYFGYKKATESFQHARYFARIILAG